MKRLNIACILLLLPVWANAQDNTPSAPKMVTSYAELLALLETDSVMHQAKTANQAIVIPTSRGPIDAAMLIRWAADDGVVHFVQSMSLKVTPAQLPAVEAAIVRLNHAMPVPGLGLNHQTNSLYFRMTVPLLPRAGLLDTEVRTYFRHTLSQAADWHPTLSAVLTGEVAPEKAVEHYNALHRSLNKIPAGRYAREHGGGKWLLAFDGAGTVRVLRDGQEMAVSAYKLEGDRITLNDRSGPVATDAKGVYTFRLNGKQLTFGLVEDAAGGRQAVLLSGPWTQE